MPINNPWYSLARHIPKLLEWLKNEHGLILTESLLWDICHTIPDTANNICLHNGKLDGRLEHELLDAIVDHVGGAREWPIAVAPYEWRDEFFSEFIPLARAAGIQTVGYNY